jgi:hypothetical protein
MIEVIAERTIGVLLRLIGWSTREIRIANACAKSARAHGLRLNRRALRRALQDAEFTTGLNSSSALAKARLNALLAPPPGADELEDVFRALQDASLERINGGSPALVTMDRRAQARAEALGSQIAASDAASALFETHLGTLLPLRASALREIHRTYPRVSQVLGDLLSASDRGQRMRDWAESIPSLVSQGPVDIYGALADLAVDFADVETSNAFIEAGLAAGLSPRAYWQVLLADRAISRAATPDELRSQLSAHLDYPLTRAMLLDGGAASAIQLLQNWQPSGAREDEHRQILLARLLLREHDLDGAIAVADEAYRQYMSRGAALLAVQARVARHEMPGHASAVTDLEDALTLAERACADRESLRLRSDKEFAWIVRVLRVMGDGRGALNRVASVADDPSVRDLLMSPEVAGEAAMLYAAGGELSIARQYLERSDPVAALRAEATIAEREDRNADAIELWHRVVAESDDWNDKATGCLRLAFHGVESEFLVELSTANAQIAADIRLAAALFGNLEGAVAQARQMAATSRGALDFLLMYHRRQGEEDQALVVARAAAQRLGEPELWIEVARLERIAGDNQAALDATKEAIARSTARWGQRKLAFQLMVESSSAVGDWQGARDAASHLLAVDPGDPSATWALTYCLVRLNDLPAALNCWRSHGRPEPYDTMSIDAWTMLVREFGDQVGMPSDGLRYANMFAGDQHVRERLIGAFVMRARPQRDGDDSNDVHSDVPDTAPSTEAALAFQTLMADYIRDFPDGAIRMVQVDTDDILGSLARELGEAPDTSELDEKVHKGELPRALAAEIHNREYATVVATLARRGPTFAAPATEGGTRTVQQARSQAVILDTTAACTLALLPTALRTSLIGYFGSVQTTLGQQGDAHEAALAAARDSGLSIIPPRAGQPAGITNTPESELAAHRQLVGELESILRATAGVAHTTGTGVPELQETNWHRPGLDALGLAAVSFLPLWADDGPLGLVAQATGVAAFTTADLLDEAAAAGAISEEERGIAIASLVSHGYAGFPFERTPWDMARQMEGDPYGILRGARYAARDSVTERVDWLLRLADSRRANAHELRDIVGVMAEWVEEIAGTEEQASTNIQQICRLILGRRWLSSSTLPWCVMGLKNQRLRVDAVSSMLHEIFRAYERVAAEAEPRLAAEFVFELVSQLEAADATRVRSAILRDRFE